MTWFDRHFIPVDSRNTDGPWEFRKCLEFSCPKNCMSYLEQLDLKYAAGLWIKCVGVPMLRRR